MKKGWVLLGVAIAALLLLIVTVYKFLGELGNAFIITIVILAIAYALVDTLRCLKARKKNKK